MAKYKERDLVEYDKSDLTDEYTRTLVQINNFSDWEINIWWEHKALPQLQDHIINSKDNTIKAKDRISGLAEDIRNYVNDDNIGKATCRKMVERDLLALDGMYPTASFTLPTGRELYKRRLLDHNTTLTKIEQVFYGQWVHDTRSLILLNNRVCWWEAVIKFSYQQVKLIILLRQKNYMSLVKAQHILANAQITLAEMMEYHENFLRVSPNAKIGFTNTDGELIEEGRGQGSYLTVAKYMRKMYCRMECYLQILINNHERIK